MKRYELLRMRKFEEGKKYLKVYLLDEEGMEIQDFVGRYTPLNTAKLACDDFVEEELDGDYSAQFVMIEYLHSNDQNKRTERDMIFIKERNMEISFYDLFYNAVKVGQEAIVVIDENSEYTTIFNGKITASMFVYISNEWKEYFDHYVVNLIDVINNKLRIFIENARGLVR